MLRLFIGATVLSFIIGCSDVPKVDNEADKASQTQSALLGEDLLVDGVLETIDGNRTYDNIIVTNGGVLQVTDYDGFGTTGTLTLWARLSIVVDATSSIIADAAGFRGGSGTMQAGEGPGAGGAATADGGGGAGHGGVGGQGTGDGNCIPDGAAGGAYGSDTLDDVTMGSGGGGAIDNSAGGDGGGAIVLLAPSIQIEGSVSANGEDGEPQPSGGAGDGGGGGAGGSVTLITDTLDCGLTGYLSASGGRGGNQSADGGGGGGGRIKLSTLNIVNSCATYLMAGQTPDCVDDPPNYYAAVDGTMAANDGVGLAAFCGNHATEPWEGCDDGGTIDGDACSAICLLEDSVYPCYYDSHCASGICDDSPGTCVACIDSAQGTATDLGCHGATPYCDDSGTPVCAAAVCEDDNTGAVPDTLCTTPGSPFCDTSNFSNPRCISACLDDNAGDEPDSACVTNPDRFCDTSGSNPECVAAVCTDDETGPTPDTGCNAVPFNYCDVSDSINNPGCIAGCTDIGSGEVDTGCSGPVESGSLNSCNESGSNPRCVDCIDIGDCTGGDGCNPTNNTCEPGCFENDDCAGTTPICSLPGGPPGVCVECLVVEDCPGSGRVCVATMCRLDSDGDGVPDTTECPADPTCPDSDGDGDADQLDTDADNDGAEDAIECPAPGTGCTDSDGDDVPDYIESGVIDTDGDGNFDQQDGDDDNDGTLTSVECGSVPYCPDTDGEGIPDHLDGAGSVGDSGDSDGDGFSDATECPNGYICPDEDDNGIPDYFQAAAPGPADAGVDAGIDAGSDAATDALGFGPGVAGSGCQVGPMGNSVDLIALLVLLIIGMAWRIRTCGPAYTGRSIR